MLNRENFRRQDGKRQEQPPSSDFVTELTKLTENYISNLEKFSSGLDQIASLKINFKDFYYQGDTKFGEPNITNVYESLSIEKIISELNYLNERANFLIKENSDILSKIKDSFDRIFETDNLESINQEIKQINEYLVLLSQNNVKIKNLIKQLTGLKRVAYNKISSLEKEIPSSDDSALSSEKKSNFIKRLITILTPKRETKIREEDTEKNRKDNIINQYHELAREVDINIRRLREVESTNKNSLINLKTYDLEEFYFKKLIQEFNTFKENLGKRIISFEFLEETLSKEDLEELKRKYIEEKIIPQLEHRLKIKNLSLLLKKRNIKTQFVDYILLLLSNDPNFVLQQDFSYQKIEQLTGISMLELFMIIKSDLKISSSFLDRIFQEYEFIFLKPHYLENIKNIFESVSRYFEILEKFETIVSTNFGGFYLGKKGHLSLVSEIHEEKINCQFYEKVIIDIFSSKCDKDLLRFFAEWKKAKGENYYDQIKEIEKIYEKLYRKQLIRDKDLDFKNFLSTFKKSIDIFSFDSLPHVIALFFYELKNISEKGLFPYKNSLKEFFNVFISFLDRFQEEIKTNKELKTFYSYIKTKTLEDLVGFEKDAFLSTAIKRLNNQLFEKNGFDTKRLAFDLMVVTRNKDLFLTIINDPNIDLSLVETIGENFSLLISRLSKKDQHTFIETISNNWDNYNYFIKNAIKTNLWKVMVGSSGELFSLEEIPKGLENIFEVSSEEIKNVATIIYYLKTLKDKVYLDYFDFGLILELSYHKELFEKTEILLSTTFSQEKYIDQLKGNIYKNMIFLLRRSHFFPSIEDYISAIEKIPFLAKLDISRLDLSKIIDDLDKFRNQVKHISLFLDLDTSQFIGELLVYYWDSIKKLEPEKVPFYLDLSLKLRESSSGEVQKILNFLFDQILESSDPKKTYQLITTTFEQNIPYVVKVFTIFQFLHPREVLDNKLKDERLSPTLRTETHRKRLYTIYTDLLNIHILSGNRSLIEFVKVLKEGEKTLEKAELQGFESLTEKERRQLEYFFFRLEVLHFNSYLGRRNLEFIPSGDLEGKYQKIKKSLGLRDDQKIIDFVLRFLKPVARVRGEEDILQQKGLDYIISLAKESKEKAHQRNLQLYQGGRKVGNDVYFSFNEGDLLKGVPSEFLENSLENGIVAKEYLGWAAGSDTTPLDTDAVRLEKENISTFASGLSAYNVRAYGDTILVIKNRNQWVDTTTWKKTHWKKQIENRSGYLWEIFVTGMVSDLHVGIRTGLPSTEIDFIVVTRETINNPLKLEKIFYQIARNGFYIPVVDENGKVIFTPELYSEYRKIFSGIEKFDGDPLEIKLISQYEFSGKSQLEEKINEIIDQKKPEIETLPNLNTVIKKFIESVLSSIDISLRDEQSLDIRGADLPDIGSTSRLTNIPGSYDFDFTLRVEPKYKENIPEIAMLIKSRLVFEKDESHIEENFYQIRLKGVKSFQDENGVDYLSINNLINKESIDLDIGIMLKNQFDIFGSHEAVEEKLEWIKNNLGEEVYQQVIANIVLAKEILTEGKAYKRVEHGGFGGIGVENWILLYNGNIIEAFTSFLKAAYDIENGQIRPFEEFKKIYKIFNPGVNVKHEFSDNYIENMQERGYLAMIETIENYLKNIGIDWRQQE